MTKSRPERLGETAARIAETERETPEFNAPESVRKYIINGQLSELLERIPASRKTLPQHYQSLTDL